LLYGGYFMAITAYKSEHGDELWKVETDRLYTAADELPAAGHKMV
jgi:hypothetical protein